MLHLLVCSLFHPPFREQSFDLVHCQGVLHHTYSTKKAFSSIARFVNPQEGYLFVWLYAIEDSAAAETRFSRMMAKLVYFVEHLVRPLISRASPSVRGSFITLSSYIAAPIVKMRMRNRRHYTLDDTRHSLRDTFTPRYAHRHSFNQVIEWFEHLGYTCDVQSPHEYRKLFNKRLWGVGVRGYLNGTPEGAKL